MFETREHLLYPGEITELLNLPRTKNWAGAKEGMLEASIPSAKATRPPKHILDLMLRAHHPYRMSLGYPMATRITGWVIEYNVGDYYPTHTDLFNLADSPSTTGIVMLTEHGTFEGGTLTVAGEPWRNDGYGNAIFFAGSQPHSLSPILTGQRIVLVTWAR
jgi:hypothetical protein